MFAVDFSFLFGLIQCVVNNLNLLILLLSNDKKVSLQLYENANIMRLKIAEQRLQQDFSYITFQTKKIRDRSRIIASRGFRFPICDAPFPAKV